MIIQDILNILEEMSPLHYAESFDNVGLLVGDANMHLKKVLVTLDCLESVVDEAIEKGCNLIISFHPIIFKGLKKLNGKDYVERVVIKAIQHNIAIFSMHTALDNDWLGVNHQICLKLGLEKQQVLIAKNECLMKLNTYVPKSHIDRVRTALLEVGAGTLGNYSSCSYSSEGVGSFKANVNANPHVGEIGKLHFEEEIQLQVTFETHLKSKVINSLHQSHPYEEVAYELSKIENLHPQKGMGRVGELKEPISEAEAMMLIKNTFHTQCIRHSNFIGKPIKRIAVLGGSGAFAIGAAKKEKADLYITSDVKYHEFFQAENQLIIADIGHYESEQYTKDLIIDYLRKKISIFASAYNQNNIVLSEINTNPIKYF